MIDWIFRASGVSRAAIVVIGIALFALLFTTCLIAPSVHASEGTEPVSGLYDEAGVLSDDEAREIEARIAEVEATGAPTVVYLRLLHTESDQAVADAQRLMEDWEVESEPGARDGFVVFLNLEPEDPDRGELGIVAGETHYDGGALPQSELDRIRDQMIDYLADDRMADGIIHGLELTAQRLEAGPPEPGAFESFIERVASGPVSILNVLSLAAIAILGMVGWRVWADRPQSRQVHYQSTTELPADEHPAIAGALEAGRVRHPQIEATMIVLGRRGALQFEPDPDEDEQVRVRLLDTSLAETSFESKLLEVLSKHAEDGVLAQKQLQGAQTDWNDVQELIRSELVQRGLFAPDASQRRRPLLIYGIVSLLLSAAALISLGFVDEPWPLGGAVALFLTSIVLFSLFASYPSTTIEGERAAAPWRAYRKGMREASDKDGPELNLDEVFPYIVAVSLAADFHDRLEKASEDGYIPAWFQITDDPHYASNTWFIYWVSFHSTMTPQTSGSGSTPGGAAAGSGGAGGRF